MNHATQIAVDTSELFFEEGIIGVTRARRFQLLEQKESPLLMLRSLDVNGFALPVVDPQMVDPSYQPRINARITQALGLKNDGSLLILAVATLESDGAVANLRAPLLINTATRVGAQVILEDRSLPLRAPLKTKSTATK